MDVVQSIASEPVYGNVRPALSQHPIDDVWLYSVRIDPGHFNVTPHTDGPSEPVSESGGIGSVAGGTAMLAVAAPLVIIPLAFVLFRRARRLGVD
jgi:hypothetical protein